jgi:hypothetical protein
VRGRKYKEPKLISLQQKIISAERDGDKARANDLQQAYGALAAEVDREGLMGLRNTAKDKTERDVIDLYAEYAAQTNYQHLTADSPLGKLLGQVPVDGDRPARGSDRYSSYFGFISRNGWLLSFQSISFVNVAEGAPALVKWLCSKGCIDIKYEFIGGIGLDEDE